jgi:excisionase family DNA binding protein
MSSRMSVKEIAEDLEKGKMAVYEMLETGILPGVRVGKQWLVTRQAYEQWRQTCGMLPSPAQLAAPQPVQPVIDRN